MKHLYFTLLVLIYFAFCPFTRAITLKDSLRAWYPFTHNTIDSSGYGYNAINEFAVRVNDRFNRSNCAYYFDGIKSDMKLPISFDYSKRTISLWFNAKSITSTSGVIYCSDNNSLLYGLTTISVVAPSQKYVRFSQGGKQFDVVINPSTWYHAVIVVNTDSTSFYVNGSYKGKFVTGTYYSPDTASLNAKYAILGKDSRFNNPFNGNIDDIRIYNRALSASEVTQLYNETYKMGNGFEAFFPFSGNLIDSTGNDNKDTLHSAVFAADRFNRSSNAMYFNGFSRISFSQAFDFMQRTVSVWFRLDSNVNSTIYCSDNKSLIYGKTILSVTGGVSVINLNYIVGNQTFSVPVSLKTWYHAVIAVDSMWTYFYLDGTLVKTSFPTNFTSSANGVFSALLGTDRNYLSPFTGSIDDIRIYSRTLSSAEVLQIDTIDDHYSGTSKNLKISLIGGTGWEARKGFTEGYYLICENTGQLPVKSALAKLTRDNLTTFKSASPAYDSNSGNVYKWNIPRLRPGNKKIIYLTLSIDSANFNIGDTVIHFASVSSTSAESDLLDNYDTLKQVIVSSVDPNDKQCTPDGDIEPETSLISYQIRFENTGTAVAYRVRVIDTIETNHLSLTKIALTTKHPYTLNINGNVLTCIFDNIFLPPNSIDPVGSKGFIRYSLYLIPHLSLGTKIRNNAYIYFDYQLPVQTNKTLNTIAHKNGIDTSGSIKNQLFSVYPNPVSNKIFIKTRRSDNSITGIKLCNLIGQELMKIKPLQNETIEVDVSSLTTGLYFLSTLDNLYSVKIIINK